MMLARFYKLSPEFPEPKYSGKTPFLVVADHSGGKPEHHGTTVLTQTFRGLWGPFYGGRGDRALQGIAGEYKRHFGLCRKIAEYNSGQFKTAGFCMKSS